LARKREVAGKWERIREQNMKSAEESAAMRAHKEKRTTLWLEAGGFAARTNQLGKLLVHARWAKRMQLLQDGAARKIQKVARGYIGWRKTMEDAKMRTLRRRVEKFLFQRLFTRRIDRRKKSAAIIYRYCEEIKEAEGLRTVCQRFRLSVIKAQRVVRNFLAIRHTQVEVLERFWEIKEEKLKQQAEDAAKDSKTKGKGKGKAKKGFKPVPELIRKEIIREDISNRRKKFEADKDEMIKKAEVEMAKNLLQGVEVRAKTIEFHFLPTEEHMFELIAKGREMEAQAKSK